MISIILTLALFGFILWLINTYVPMDGTIKRIINILAIVLVVLYLLSTFGLLGFLDAPVPRIH
jgi:hypothetical protein